MNLSNEKKVLIVHDYLTVFGGAEKVLEGIISAFPDADIFTSKYSPSKFENTKISQSFLERRIKESFIFKYFVIPDFLVPLQRKLAFISFLFLDISKYDILIFNTSSPATWILSRKRNNQKFIAYYHKISSIDFYSKKSFAYKLFSKLNKYFISKLDLIITNSKFNSFNFSSIYNIPETKIRVIYPFLSENDFKLIEKCFSTVKENFYIFIGRLEEYKGVVQIVDACVSLGLNLKVVGEGPLANTLKKGPTIEYLGYVDKVTKFDLLSKSKAMISLGGLREEFGITYLESLVCGTPYISLNKGGAVEIGDKDSALFLKEVDELDEALKYFEKYPLEITSERRNKLIEKYSENRFINEIIQVCLI